MIRSNKGKVTLDGTGEEILVDLGMAVAAIYGAFLDAVENDEKSFVEDAIIGSVAKGLSSGKKKAMSSREETLDPDIKNALMQAAKELFQILEDKENDE